MDSSQIYRDRPAIILWLTLCTLLIALMVLVGGYTRLSGSGLSITVWKPIHGTLPPLSDSDWQEEFAAYQASPQYRKINSDMRLEEFKSIFWPEFLHRLLGRIIGAVFMLPLIVFALRRSISRTLVWRLIAIFALGGLQGLMGWLMVKSGLVDMPSVSHIRLALHLGLAFAIFGLILWILLSLTVLRDPLIKVNAAQYRWYRIWFTGLCLQIVYGAFMAGLHAGLFYNTWPTMNGQWLPDGLVSALPWYGNLSENLIMIQFIHRKLAVLLAVGFLFWWWSYREYAKSGPLGKMCIGVALILAVQFTLGVATLLNLVPLPLALAHQMTALVLFAASVVLLHTLASARDIKDMGV